MVVMMVRAWAGVARNRTSTSLWESMRLAFRHTQWSCWALVAVMLEGSGPDPDNWGITLIATDR
jgi:hypothetical protein